MSRRPSLHQAAFAGEIRRFSAKVDSTFDPTKAPKKSALRNSAAAAASKADDARTGAAERGSRLAFPGTPTLEECESGEGGVGRGRGGGGEGARPGIGSPQGRQSRVSFSFDPVFPPSPAYQHRRSIQPPSPKQQQQQHQQSPSQQQYLQPPTQQQYQWTPPRRRGENDDDDEKDDDAISTTSSGRKISPATSTKSVRYAPEVQFHGETRQTRRSSSCVGTDFLRRPSVGGARGFGGGGRGGGLDDDDDDDNDGWMNKSYVSEGDGERPRRRKDSILPPQARVR